MKRRGDDNPMLLLSIIVIGLIVAAGFVYVSDNGFRIAAPITSSPAASDMLSPGASAPDSVHAGDPKTSLTPGVIDPAVTQANIKTTICVSGYTAKIRPSSSYTTSLKKTQIIAYGYTDTATASYEEDHLISLELGGAPKDPKNLWPEPYKMTYNELDTGARVKDKYENWLHTQVCAGKITLVVAQTDISRDWVGAWITAGTPGSSATAAPNTDD